MLHFTEGFIHDQYGQYSQRNIFHRNSYKLNVQSRTKCSEFTEFTVTPRDELTDVTLAPPGSDQDCINTRHLSPELLIQSLLNKLVQLKLRLQPGLVLLAASISNMLSFNVYKSLVSVNTYQLAVTS